MDNIIKKNNHISPLAFLILCNIIGFFLLVLSVSIKPDLWQFFFWNNKRDNAYLYHDTGMDFFHSIEYLKGNNPYVQWHTIYPPLANLFFAIIINLVPGTQKEQWTDNYDDSNFMRTTPNDLRLWMPTLMVFILFIVLVTVLVCVIISKYLSDCKNGYIWACTIPITYGYMYALERGNIIILSLLFTLLFFIFYDSNSKTKKEIALISLAIAANLKIYPAIFGIILIFEKHYKEAIRTIIYGIIFLIAPCFFFKGGISNLGEFVKNVTEYSNMTEWSNKGTALENIVFSVYSIIKKVFHFEIPRYWLIFISPLASFVIFILLMIFSFVLKQKWQKCLSITLAFVLYKNQSVYILCFFIIATVLFLKEEKVITKNNILPIIGFALVGMCCPIYSKPESDFSLMYLRLQIGLIILLYYLSCEAISQIKTHKNMYNKEKVMEVKNETKIS